ncbi:MAG TPA: YdeI/OmpD-associated family protein [Solirubrobacter sp.]|nr:YdeI/OmpD-associated family protein [Solirubrobacter sp.]
MSDLPVLTFADKDEFAAWMEANHATSDGIWIKVAKKGTGVPSVHPPEALDVALCYGWIDGLRKSLDDRHYLQKYTPRRARSKWSKINVAKAEALVAAGEMRPAGLAEIERAKADGRWDAAYDSPKNMKVPPDLQAELDKDPAAAAFFASLDSTNRYAILYRLHDAKRPETRARRLAQYVDALKRGEKLH